METISLESLRRADMETCSQLYRALREQRFALIKIDDLELRDSLATTVRKFEPEKSFRFPARDGVCEYDESSKNCFQILYQAAVACVGALWGAEPELAQAYPLVKAKVHSALADDFALFDGLDPNTPFSGKEAPFANTFFNIFNYDHGMLNEHKDRGLITCIYIAPGEGAPEGLSQLWVGRGIDDWVAMDALVDGGQLVIFVGDELEEMGREVGVELIAAEHSVRVSPTGEYVDYSHSRRDPDAQASGNRRSAALILCS